MAAASLILGIAVLILAWTAGLEASSHSFAMHMTVHMSLVAIAAPLLALGVAGRSWDPVRCAPWAFSAMLASFVELGVVWLWHLPGLHAAARSGGWALAAEQGSFLAAGLYLWLSVFGGSRTARSARRVVGIAALLLTVMHMTLLGALLALAPRPLYSLHGHAGESALEDQHLGGVIMLLVGGLSYLAAGLWLTFELVTPSDRRAR